MNRLDIIKAVAKVLTTKGEAALAVETTFETIRLSLNQGDKVVISNFGTFRVKSRTKDIGIYRPKHAWHFSDATMFTRTDVEE